MTAAIDRPLADLVAGLRAGDFAATELAEAAAANHRKRDDLLQAYKTWDEDKARAQAEAADAAFAAGIDCGPLQGLPVSVKDIYGVAGYPTFAGSPKQLPAEWEAEGPVVRAVRDNLAVITGKTHTVEFAFGGLGSNAHWKTARNPWDDQNHRCPGGSSAGAGVSLCEGSAVVALGSDTAGSVRIPASMTGTVGVKTSVGRWSTDGITPLSRTLDTPGVLTRSVADAITAFSAIDPTASADPAGMQSRLGHRDVSTLRIGVCDLFFEDCAPGIAEGVKGALDELAVSGAKILNAELPEVKQANELFRRGGLAASEFAAFILGTLPDWRDTLDPNVAARFERMEAIPAVDYLRRLWRFDELAKSMAERLRAFDMVVGPTVPITTPTLTEIETPEGYHENNMGALRNTNAVNTLRLCAITMPVGLDKAGMPIGLQPIARHGEDEALLAAALAMERVLGTPRQRLGTPPLCQ
jgi:aspartyl-tRNA(Asn)/glutamyl-tRNA(Gln) amidotransferase subunit A